MYVFMTQEDRERLMTPERKNIITQAYKLGRTKDCATKRRMLQKVEKHKVESNRTLQKAEKKVENCGTVYRKNPLGLGLG
jgi:hypothetical protein